MILKKTFTWKSKSHWLQVCAWDHNLRFPIFPSGYWNEFSLSEARGEFKFVLTQPGYPVPSMI